MKVYNYDKNTKEFLSTSDAAVNPLDKDSFLIPANATTIKPLETKKGFTICFNDDKWEYVEDNRNKTVYSIEDKTESLVDYLGAIKDGFTLLVPAQFDKWEVDKWVEDTKTKIKAEAEEKVQAIEDYVYSKYPLTKQTQDDKWEANFSTKLKATGVTELEKKIVEMVTSFFSGKTLAEIVSGLDDAVKPLYEKLVKIGVRNEWAYLCIQEGTNAIAEQREAVYPEFPNFD